MWKIFGPFFFCCSSSSGARPYCSSGIWLLSFSWHPKSGRRCAGRLASGVSFPRDHAHFLVHKSRWEGRTEGGRKTPALSSGKYMSYYFCLLFCWYCLSHNTLCDRLNLNDWVIRRNAWKWLSSRDAKQWGFLVLICAHYFAGGAARNLHAMRRNQLRSSHRQSPSAIKRFIYLFIFIKRKRKRLLLLLILQGKIWMSQHTNLLTHNQQTQWYRKEEQSIKRDNVPWLFWGGGGHCTDTDAHPSGKRKGKKVEIHPFTCSFSSFSFTLISLHFLLDQV